MLGAIQKIEINEANLNNNHIYLRSFINFFPANTVGGGNIAERAEKEIRITLPFGEDIYTDIAGDKKIFRKRSWVRQLFKHHDAKPGDQVTMTWIAPLHLKIDMEKTVMAVEAKIGESIQIPIATAAWLTRFKFEIPAAFQSFFPADALGARGEPEQDRYPARGMPVELDFGMAKDICDLATKGSGVMRPRTSVGTRQFYEANRAAVGDYVCLTRVAERKYHVTFVRQA